jgi:tRNA (mo5U34)-methyltransferase
MPELKDRSHTPELNTEQPSLAERVAEVSWYQSVRLPDGSVTPSEFDTIDELTRIPFPASLAGKRCLDVGTANGFWAFEMERRGAAEVVAIDLRDTARFDWPGNSTADLRAAWEREFERPSGFAIAHEALGSSVQWRELPVYDLAPDVVGEFDFVFIGSLLLHLRDPIAALAAINRVLRGELLSVDSISPPLTIMHPTQAVARLEAPGRPLWWMLNLRAYRRLFEAAGLDILARGRPFFIRPGKVYNFAPSSRRSIFLRLQEASLRFQGVLSTWVRARSREAA